MSDLKCEDIIDDCLKDEIDNIKEDLSCPQIHLTRSLPQFCHN